MTTKNLNYQQEIIELKQRLSFHAEGIATNLLGKPNKYLSNKYVLCWQEDGKIAMKIKGSKAGIWYDFSKGKGGIYLVWFKEKGITILTRLKNTCRIW